MTLADIEAAVAPLLAAGHQVHAVALIGEGRERLGKLLQRFSAADIADMREAAHGLLASDGVPVSIVHDSPGFVAQRVIACCQRP